LRELRQRILRLQQFAHENQLKEAQRQKSFHDAKAEAHHFEIGDKVFVWNVRNDEKGVKGKLNWRWGGPHTVIGITNPVTYTLQDKHGKTFNAHAEDMNKVDV